MLPVGPATRRSIHENLEGLKLLHPGSGKLWWRFSPTIGRLKACGLRNPDKFNAYMKLIGALIKMARDDKDKREYTVHVPSVEALMGIRIEALMQNKEARQDIVRLCYRPEEVCINLRKLISINHKYFPELEIKD